ncbi:MAG: iron-sulfur cluster assembly scaffold protein [Campylobacterales bacterium]|nr:iron-sulfur cluster assembly scaffold protein [Campylobacterales bacterium]
MTVDAQLIEHMMNPQNYGVLKDSDAEGIGKNPQNGEKVIIFLKVREDEEGPFIEDIKFQAIGCTTTVVAGSIITTEAKGVSFERGEDIIAFTLGMLDRVPPEEAACSEMVAVALKAAMDTYVERQKDPDFPIITYKIQKNCQTDEGEKADENLVDQNA